MGYQPINWNRPQDSLDVEVWNRLTSNFWLPEKVPVSNDLKGWERMTDEQRNAVDKVFGGLTALDTLQSQDGAVVMHQDAKTQHEQAVFSQILFMEAVHAKSYSTIFSTLRSTEKIDEIFQWAITEPLLQDKIDIIDAVYGKRHYSCLGKTEEWKNAFTKAASVMLESFLFYSGFYLPLKFSSMGKLTNTADIIRLILRDEGVHGFYIGYKYQQIRAELSSFEQETLDSAVYRLLFSLYEIEEKYTELIYDPLGWTANVKSYLRYNANKALNNLGYEGTFDEDTAQPEAVILSSMTIDANENHDFFSGSGSSYVIGKAEETNDDDWS